MMPYQYLDQTFHYEDIPLLLNMKKILAWKTMRGARRKITYITQYCYTTVQLSVITGWQVNASVVIIFQTTSFNMNKRQ